MIALKIKRNAVIDGVSSTMRYSCVGSRLNPEENEGFCGSAAHGAAVVSENAPIDHDLQAIIERWPDLPAAVKAGILAMVKASDD